MESTNNNEYVFWIELIVLDCNLVICIDVFNCDYLKNTLFNWIIYGCFILKYKKLKMMKYKIDK